VVIVATWLSCPCQGRSRSVVIIISFPVFFSPDEALMALAVMHNLAPEELKFKNSAGLCVSFSKKNG